MYISRINSFTNSCYMNKHRKQNNDLSIRKTSFVDVPVQNHKKQNNLSFKGEKGCGVGALIGMHTAAFSTFMTTASTEPLKAFLVLGATVIGGLAGFLLGGALEEVIRKR